MKSIADRRERVADIDRISASIKAVDRRGRDAEAKWGFGRLQTLVPVEWADRFAAQSDKFSRACYALDVGEVVKHGSAMERALAKLDEIAEAAGGTPKPVEQWEFEGPDGLVILVRDIAETHQVEKGGRRCEVWSLDEIANILKNYPVLSSVKHHFEGAVVTSVRPKINAGDLNDSLEEFPFSA